MVKIKREADLKDIPLVFWTTSNEEEDRIFCAEAGAFAYVTKPNSFLEWDAAIRDIVENGEHLPGWFDLQVIDLLPRATSGNA